MHDVIAFGTVLAAILAGILLNRSDTKELRDKLDALRSDMDNKFAGVNERFAGVNERFAGMSERFDDKFDSLRSEMHGEFERFYMTLGEHDAKIANLEKR